MHLILFMLSAVLILGSIFFIANRFRPKYFYIVRHGQTLLNQAHIKQGVEGSLSQHGIAQATAVGVAFMPIGIEEICSSTYPRALETAQIMNEQLKCALVPTELLAERKNPSEVIGQGTNDPEVERITGLTAYGYHPDGFRFSDEENFEDLRERAKKCLDFLAHRPTHRIAVVTHHAFLQMLLSYLLYRDTLDADGYVKLAFFNPAENGGVTLCVYHPWHNPTSPTKGWEIRGYNQTVK